MRQSSEDSLPPVSGTAAYDVTTDDRLTLARDLVTFTEAIFDHISKYQLTLHIEKNYLLEAFELIGKESPDTIIHRARAINQLFTELPDLFNSLETRVTLKEGHGERKLVRKLKKFIKKLNNLTNRSLSLSEYANYVSNPVDSAMIEFKVSKLSAGLWVVFDLSLLKLEEKGKQGTSAEKAQLEQWLKSMSPDVLSAYKKTEEILKEVMPLVDTPEDEYFIEQISHDYYPHIFAALENFNRENSDFNHKETVVNESMKQFRIIQLGLQKIIDNTVTRHLNSMRSQTDFLRNKIVGETGLILSANDADALIETSMEEADRIREELYKKHVAPVLERNKQEYEQSLSALQEDYDQKLDEKDKDHQATLIEERSRYKEELDRRALQEIRTVDDLKAALSKSDDENQALKTQIAAMQKKLNNYESPVFDPKELPTEKMTSSQLQLAKAVLQSQKDRLKEIDRRQLNLAYKGGSKEDVEAVWVEWFAQKANVDTATSRVEKLTALLEETKNERQVRWNAALQELKESKLKKLLDATNSLMNTEQGLASASPEDYDHYDALRSRCEQEFRRVNHLISLHVHQKGKRRDNTLLTREDLIAELRKYANQIEEGISKDDTSSLDKQNVAGLSGTVRSILRLFLMVFPENVEQRAGYRTLDMADLYQVAKAKQAVLAQLLNSSSEDSGEQDGDQTHLEAAELAALLILRLLEKEIISETSSKEGASRS